jgi:hypothetical protein
MLCTPGHVHASVGGSLQPSVDAALLTGADDAAALDLFGDFDVDALDFDFDVEPAPALMPLAAVPGGGSAASAPTLSSVGSGVASEPSLAAVEALFESPSPHALPPAPSPRAVTRPASPLLFSTPSATASPRSVLLMGVCLAMAAFAAHSLLASPHVSGGMDVSVATPLTLPWSSGAAAGSRVLSSVHDEPDIPLLIDGGPGVAVNSALYNEVLKQQQQLHQQAQQQQQGQQQQPVAVEQPRVEQQEQQQQDPQPEVALVTVNSSLRGRRDKQALQSAGSAFGQSAALALLGRDRDNRLATAEQRFSLANVPGMEELNAALQVCVWRVCGVCVACVRMRASCVRLCGCGICACVCVCVCVCVRRAVSVVRLCVYVRAPMFDRPRTSRAVS